MTKPFKVLRLFDLYELTDEEVADELNHNRGAGWSRFTIQDMYEHPTLLTQCKRLTENYHVLLVSQDILNFERAFKSAFGYVPVRGKDGDYTEEQVRDAKALWDMKKV